MQMAHHIMFAQIAVAASSLERVGLIGVRGTVTLPLGLAGTSEWRGKQMVLRAGKQEIRM